MRESLLVGAGAVIGAFARWGLSLGFGTIAAFASLPHLEIWPLLLINFIGAAAMGYFQPGPFWGKGVLGGFTSFSAFASLTVTMTAAGAIAHVAITVTGCITCYMLADALRTRTIENPSSGGGAQHV